MRYLRTNRSIWRLSLFRDLFVFTGISMGEKERDEIDHVVAKPPHTPKENSEFLTDMFWMMAFPIAMFVLYKISQ
jgi:hypothetical protein